MSTSAALLTARRGTVFLSIVSFVLSYIALADLARMSGLGPQAYLWPVMIDGAIVVGTVAVLAKADWHSWSMLSGAALVSVAGNGIHAWISQGTWIAVGVALTPPVFLLWVTHMTVRLGREDIDPTLGQVTEVPESQSAEEFDADSALGLDPRSRALELIAEGGVPFREIARRVGVDDRTVRRWRDAAPKDAQTRMCSAAVL